jgi:hypothetical protein
MSHFSVDLNRLINFDSDRYWHLNRVEHLPFDRNFLDDLFPSVPEVDFFTDVDRHFFNDLHNFVFKDSLELVSDFDNSVNQRNLFGQNLFDLLDDGDYFFLGDLNRPVRVDGYISSSFDRRRFSDFLDFLLYNSFYYLRNLNNLLHNSRYNHYLLDNFFDLNSSRDLYDLFNYLFDNLYFRFDTLVIDRIGIGVFFLDEDRHFFLEINGIADRNLDWSFVDDGNVHPNFDRFVGLFDDFVNKRYLLDLIDHLYNLLEERFLNDSVNRFDRLNHPLDNLVSVHHHLFGHNFLHNHRISDVLILYNFLDFRHFNNFFNKVRFRFEDLSGLNSFDKFLMNFFLDFDLMNSIRHLFLHNSVLDLLDQYLFDDLNRYSLLDCDNFFHNFFDNVLNRLNILMNNLTNLSNVLVDLIYLIIPFLDDSFLFVYHLLFITRDRFFSVSVVGLNLISVDCSSEGDLFLLGMLDDFFNIVVNRYCHFLNHGNSILTFHGYTD